MAQVGEAYVDVRGRTDRLIQDVESGARTAGERGGTSLAAGFAVSAGALAASRAIVGFLNDSATAATNLGESMSKTNFVFDENAGVIHSWAEGAAEDFGLSRGEAENAASTFGNMFSQLDIGIDSTTEMSQSMTELAADFASFHNADITEVIEAQTAAFRGEYDAVQRFVPTINAAAVEQKAMELGLAATTKELDAQDKALATYQLLLDGAGEAAGDFDRTSDSLANRQRILRAEITNLQTEVGTALIPVMQVGVTVIGGMVDAFTALPAPVQTGVIALAGMAAAAVGVHSAIGTAREVFGTFSGILDVARGRIAAKTAATIADTAATATGTAVDGAAALAAFASANATELQAIAAQNSARAEVQATVAGAALAASNTAVATSGTAAGAGMSAMLGPIGLLVGAAALAGGAFLLLRDRKNEVEDATKRVTSALVDETGALNTSTEAVNGYLAASSRFGENNQVDDVQRLGLTFGELANMLDAGAAGYDAFIERARAAGEVTEGQRTATGALADAEGELVSSKRALVLANGEVLVGNVDLIRSFEIEARAKQRSAEEGSRLLQVNGLVSAEAFDAAVAINTAAGESTNWVAVNRQLSSGLQATAEGVAATGAAADSGAGSISNYAASAGRAAYSLYSLEGAAKAFAQASDASYRAVFGADDAARSYNRTIEGLTRTTRAGGGAQRDAAKDAREMERALAEVEDAEAALADAIERRQLIQAGPTENQVKIAEIEARQRKRELADATDRITDAEEALQEAQRNNTGEAIARAIAEAEREVESAKRDVERASLGVREAEERVAEARASGDPDAVRQAELDLADARDRLADESDAARLAEDDLKTAQDLGRDSAREVEQANRDLEAAKDDQVLASIDAQLAEEDLTTTRNIGKEGSQELAAANALVEEKQRLVEDATARVTELEATLTGSRSGGGGTIETTASLEEKTADAAKAGSDYIQMLVDMGAPADTIDRALLKIRDDLREVAGDSPEAQAAAEAFFQRISADAGPARDAINDVKGAAEELARVLDEGYRQSIEVALGIPQPPPASAITGQRASGGPVRSGGLYLVGERGPELIQMGGDAAVFPTQQLMAAVGGGGGTGDLVSISIGNVIGTEAGARRVASLTGATVARVLAQRRLTVDARGSR